MAPDLHILCPLEIERRAVERALADAGLHVSVTRIGPGPDATDRAVRTLASNGRPQAVLLVGIAGGLTPCDHTPPIAEIIGDAGTRYACPLHPGRDQETDEGVSLIGRDRVVGTIELKRLLHEKSGASLVDTESHAFAAACDRAGLDWGVVRSVSDAHDQWLPSGIDRWVDSRGCARPMAAGLAVVRRPVLIPRLIRLGRESQVAADRAAAQAVRIARRLRDER